MTAACHSKPSRSLWRDGIMEPPMSSDDLPVALQPAQMRRLVVGTAIAFAAALAAVFA